MHRLLTPICFTVSLCPVASPPKVRVSITSSDQQNSMATAPIAPRFATLPIGALYVSEPDMFYLRESSSTWQ